MRDENNQMTQRTAFKRQLSKKKREIKTLLTSTSPKGEEVGPGIKQLLGKAQYLEFVWKQVVNQIG